MLCDTAPSTVASTNPASGASGYKIWFGNQTNSASSMTRSLTLPILSMIIIISFSIAGKVVELPNNENEVY
jgi:hypothetical protein